MKAVSGIRFSFISILLTVLLVGARQQVAMAEAVVIAGWDMAGINLGNITNDASYRINAHTSAVEMTKAELTLSTNVNSSTANDSYGFKISTADQTTSLGESIASDHYFEVALQTASGYRLNLNSMELNGGTDAKTSCDDIAVLSDVDGFVTNGVIVAVTGVAGLTGGFDARSSSTNGFGGPIDFSHQRFSGIEAIRIRFYGWNSSGSTGPTSIRNLSGYDVKMFGTIAQLPRGTVMIAQ